MKKYTLLLVSCILTGFLQTAFSQQYKYWYDNPEIRSVQILEGQKSGSCWAICYAIMYNWRNNTTYSADQLLQKLRNPKYYKIYTDEVGLPPDEWESFARATTLQVEPLGKLTVKGWYDLLEKYGPLMVFLDKNGSDSKIVGHAEIIYGMKSFDGTPHTTGFLVLDPAWEGSNGEDAAFMDESFELFVERYESYKAKAPNEVSVQILHWPKQNDEE